MPDRNEERAAVEPCVCGREPVVEEDPPVCPDRYASVICAGDEDGGYCWSGPTVIGRGVAIDAWNRVMRAARRAEEGGDA